MRPIVNVPEEDRAADIGNKHKNLVKIARVVPEIFSRTDRQTHRHTYSSQYFANAPVGEVITTDSDVDGNWTTRGLADAAKKEN